MIRRTLKEADLFARDLIKIGKMSQIEQKISRQFRNDLESIPATVENFPIAVCINAGTREDVHLIASYLNGIPVPTNTIRPIPDSRVVYAHLNREQIYDLAQQSYVESIRPQRIHRMMD